MINQTLSLPPSAIKCFDRACVCIAAGPVQIGPLPSVLNVFIVTADGSSPPSIHERKEGRKARGQQLVGYRGERERRAFS